MKNCILEVSLCILFLVISGKFSISQAFSRKFVVFGSSSHRFPVFWWLSLDPWSSPRILGMFSPFSKNLFLLEVFAERFSLFWRFPRILAFFAAFFRKSRRFLVFLFREILAALGGFSKNLGVLSMRISVLVFFLSSLEGSGVFSRNVVEFWRFSKNFNVSGGFLRLWACFGVFRRILFIWVFLDVFFSKHFSVSSGSL